MKLFKKSKKESGIILAEKFQELTNNKTIIKGKNNIIKATLGKVTYNGIQIVEFFGNNNELVIEDEATLINSRVRFSGDNSKLIFRSRCSIGLNVHICGDNCLISIGEETTMARVHMVCHEDGSKIIVGKDCMFSSEVFIRNSDSHSIIDLKTDKRINPPMDVMIGDHVWVGQSVKINKGVTALDNSIIANGSIVTGQVLENTVVGGNPARVIKENVRWERELLPF